VKLPVSFFRQKQLLVRQLHRCGYGLHFDDFDFVVGWLADGTENRNAMAGPTGHPDGEAVLVAKALRCAQEAEQFANDNNTDAALSAILRFSHFETLAGVVAGMPEIDQTKLAEYRFLSDLNEAANEATGLRERAASARDLRTTKNRPWEEARNVAYLRIARSMLRRFQDALALEEGNPLHEKVVDRLGSKRTRSSIWTKLADQVTREFEGSVAGSDIPSTFHLSGDSRQLKNILKEHLAEEVETLNNTSHE
jgi:hypothetical protein